MIGLRVTVSAGAIVGFGALGACYRPPANAALRDPLPYDRPSYWLCHPDRTTGDPCRSDRSTTTLHPDGKLEVAPRPASTAKAASPSADAVDCFYVYPTVDLGLLPGHHEDFRDPTAMQEVARAQIARFSETCTVYAPLYRQVTIGTYLQSSDVRDEALAVAFVDVAAAFEAYLARVPSTRKVVLVGHSQGADMVVKLLQRYFDKNDAMKARLVVAMPIGGTVEVPIGKTAGGSLNDVPICTKALQTGCVVAFRTHVDEPNLDPGPRFEPRPGNETVCVDPITLDDPSPSKGPRRFSRSILYRGNSVARTPLRGLENAQTPFVDVEAFYGGRCASGAKHYNYLAVTTKPAPGDPRTSPIDFDRGLPKQGVLAPLGLHALDMTLPQGDLIAIVARRIAIAAQTPTPRGPAGGPRVLRYQELFTGALPSPSRVFSWTLTLAENGSATLERIQGTAKENTLLVDKAKPLGAITITEKKTFAGSWKGDLDGAFTVDLRQGSPIKCKPFVIAVLEANALLSVEAHADVDDPPDHTEVFWRPPTRTKVTATQCERGAFADEAHWESEPQPKGLLFTEEGLEYAHDNSDMVVQHGGTRRLPPPK